jgi:formylglycine-generating enzyme required for sulfatase activity
MHGNVWEWCEDDFHDNYQGAPNDGGAWVEKTNNLKVLRGGSWNLNRSYCRSALRGSSSPDYQNLDIGFRLSLFAENSP